MDWTDDVIARLRTLWEEGHSTAEIGRRLGVSKNAIVGKAHRLALPARPSPIRRDAIVSEQAKPLLVRRVDGPTLPPLASADAPMPVVVGVSPAPPPRPAPPVAVRPAPAPRPQPVAARPYGRIITCCWPIGEPGTKSFRFCDDPSEPGKPYCGDHAKLAYVKVRDRREDAA